MKPSWQQDPCPSWCTGEHREDDHPDDRVHRSAGESFSVTSRRTDRKLGEQVAGKDYEVGLSRRDGSHATWVYIGAGPGEHLELTLESARQLADALARVLPTDG